MPTHRIYFREGNVSNARTLIEFISGKEMWAVHAHSENLFPGRKCGQCVLTHRIYFREGNVSSACPPIEFISRKEM